MHQRRSLIQILLKNANDFGVFFFVLLNMLMKFSFKLYPPIKKVNKKICSMNRQANISLGRERIMIGKLGVIMKKVVLVEVALVIFILVLPATLVVVFKKTESEAQHSAESVTKPIEIDNENDITVTVFRSKEERIEEVPLEKYVAGVVASEMPAEFEKEALKAQALAARTYIVKQLLNATDIELPQGAVVTDTMMHQAFHNEKELMEKWGKDYHWKMERIQEAVMETSGLIITYEGEPIDASFFSTSNGYTENSEDYWTNSIPYLRSVASPWDKNSPRYFQEKQMSVAEFEQKLGIKLGDSPAIGTILERTSTNRVKKVNINGKMFTGRQIRELLELDSTDFTWKREGDQIIIQTKGWGHGVGMSQYGADGMAKEGKNYEQIVKYYYQGVEIVSLKPFLTKGIAKSN